MTRLHAGHLILRMRQEARLSRAALAKRAKVGRTTVYRIEETGRCHLDTFEKVKRTLLEHLAANGSRL